jgi:transcriptional regulator with XRE-family HTH domain
VSADRTDPGSLGEKVEWLLRHRWPEGRARVESDRDIAQAISEATGNDYSHSLIWKLRTGRSDNPTRKVLAALAEFFQVPFGYFGDDEEAAAAREQLDALAVVREAGLGRESLRLLASMSPEGRESVADMIETVARGEKRRAKNAKDKEPGA